MKHAVFAAATLLAGAAQAGVVYNWETVGVSDPIRSVEGRIEFAGNKWLDDVHVYIYCDANNDWPCTQPNSPVSSFSFDVSLGDGSDFAFGGSFITGQPYAPWAAQIFGLNIEFGVVSATTFDQGVTTTQGDGDLWTLEYGNDNGDHGCFDTRCVATGRWVLDPSTVPDPAQVPLPGTLALLGLGLVLARKLTR